jgi:hypothetical protein
MRNRIERLEHKARRAFAAEDWPSVASAYERLVRARPDDERAAVWWFDGALAYKFLRDWPKAYELGREAAARAERGVQDPAYWNLGIAATVLGKWAVVRDAWDGYGIGLPVPPGDGPLTLDLGLTPVRLDPGRCDEVVWAERLCPTRARIRNVPTPESGRRYGEIVVHDGFRTASGWPTAVSTRCSTNFCCSRDRTSRPRR